jgi:hypothetical protein
MLKPSIKYLDPSKSMYIRIKDNEEDDLLTPEKMEQMKFLTENHEFLYKKFNLLIEEVIIMSVC